MRSNKLAPYDEKPNEMLSKAGNKSWTISDDSFVGKLDSKDILSVFNVNYEN